MHPGDSVVVTNDLRMEGMAMLTGPNMAGEPPRPGPPRPGPTHRCPAARARPPAAGAVLERQLGCARAPVERALSEQGPHVGRNPARRLRSRPCPPTLTRPTLKPTLFAPRRPRAPPGKSTALRGIAAAALLANCGLLVPARRARVPHFDGFILRNYSGDAPEEGLSAFGVEMRDMT